LLVVGQIYFLDILVMIRFVPNSSPCYNFTSCYAPQMTNL